MLFDSVYFFGKVSVTIRKYTQKSSESSEDVANWSKCIASVPNDNFVAPEYVFPLDNGHQTKIIHTTATRTIYNYAYEFGKLAKNGLGAKIIFSKLKKYFDLISTNLCLLALLNIWIGRLNITYQVAFAGTCLNKICPSSGINGLLNR